MIIAIVATLLGIALGQFIKIEIDPKLTAFIDDSLTTARTKAVPMATTAAKAIQQSASKQVKRIAKPKQTTLDEVEARFINS